LSSPAKLVLVVVDAMKPAMLERAISTGRAPAMQALKERGHYRPDCVAAFPSVTPVCAASIATGEGPDRHAIPSMNWFHRRDGRYVEYGTSFGASRTFGIRRSLTDTIYNMNGEHLSAETPTVFEHLDDADIRTAGTTYLMYRGRHEHQPNVDTALARLATQVFRKPVQGPREFFYADLFASRRTGCKATLGMPGLRDRHSGCVAAYLMEHDLFDFLLLSLPDNDTYSHRNGPSAQVTSLAEADRQLERMMHAGGGPDAFLEEHAVIVCSDHSQSQVEAEVDLFEAFDGFEVLPPDAAKADEREIALCPASRYAQVYILDRDDEEDLRRRVIRTALALEGVDLVVHRTDHPDGEASVRSGRGELRFTPGGDLVDLRGSRWSVEGDLAALELTVEDGRVSSAIYPDALGRIWSALRCRQSGSVLLSAAPGYEFTDWGGSVHLGGGSHGSLHANDSHGVLLWAGTDMAADDRDQWALRDVTPMVLDHFGVAA
jgi:type I phosphodiesterase/nucleotide pyrophosphatase